MHMNIYFVADKQQGRKYLARHHFAISPSRCFQVHRQERTVHCCVCVARLYGASRWRQNGSRVIGSCSASTGERLRCECRRKERLDGASCRHSLQQSRCGVGAARARRESRQQSKGLASNVLSKPPCGERVGMFHPNPWCGFISPAALHIK